MKALSTVVVAAVTFLLVGTAAQAQDTCKIFSVANPHGADMTISKIWVVDTVNFQVSTVKQLPFQLGASESFEINVCVLARDGKKHATQVRYQNTHGTSSYNVSMDAPASTSDVADAPLRTAACIVGECTPNPASGTVTVPIIGKDARDVNIRIFSLNGVLVRTMAFPGAVPGNLMIDAGQLPNGYYMVVVSGGNIESTSRALVVSH